jgi:hypothetical protein
MMRPRLLMVAVLAIICVIGNAPAGAQPSAGVGAAVIIATNSVDIDRNVVLNGDVVVNEASDGPTLDGGVELNVDKAIVSGILTASGDLKADSVALNKFATITGIVSYNELFDSGASVGGLDTPLALPVFAQLPAFQSAMVNAGAPDVIVGAGGSETLDESDYGDIDIGTGATVTMTGGVYNVRSIKLGKDARLLFTEGADIRVEGDLFTGRNSVVGAASGSEVFPSEVVIYVGGINGAAGGLLEAPLAADLGRESTFSANVYAPNGTIKIGTAMLATGGFIARDVWVGTGARVNLASFVNRPPTADPLDVFTAGQTSIDIVLSGTDPEGGALSFSIDSLPTTGTLTDSDGAAVVVDAALPTPTVTFTPDDPSANAEDGFDYTVTDEGLLSDTAPVRINSPGDPVVQCTQDSDCDPGQTCNTDAGVCELAEVVANDQLCESTDPVDCSLETIQDTAITIILTGTAPCDPTGAANPAEPCDGIGDDAPLTFSLPSLTTSGGGTLSGLNQGTGELQEPPGPDEVPQRTASVLYTPAVGFTGVDTFTFEVAGDVDGSGNIDASGETDSGSVQISVQAFTAAPPVDARDQIVSTEMNTPVGITLSGPAGTCDPADPDCRPELTAPLASSLGEPATSFSASASAEAIAERLAYAGGRAVRRVSPLAPVPLASSADLAAAMDIDAALVSSSSITGDPLASDARSSLGVIMPTRGSSFAVLSTGAVGTQAEPGTDFGDPSVLGDETVLTLVLDVPAGNGLLSFDYNFLSAEHPDFIQVGFNDTFTVKLTDAAGGPRVIETAEVDFTALLDVTAANAGGSGFDLFTADPSGVDSSFAPEGPGVFADAGLTGFKSAIEPVVSGGQITLEFSIKDVGDGILDSAVILDNVVFELQQVGFTILSLPEGIDPDDGQLKVLGTLSYVDAVSDGQVDITAGDLPLLLPTDLVTYTPPQDKTGDPLARFEYQQCDLVQRNPPPAPEELECDTGFVDLVVTAAGQVVDTCVAVGRPPGCEAGGASSGGSSSADTSSEGSGEASLADQNLQVAVIGDGAGTVSSSRRELPEGSFAGLSCDEECGAWFAEGAEVVLYARPVGDNSEFIRWSGDCSGSEPITTVYVWGKRRCTAEFGKK